MTNIKAIETRYKGYRFRSRLEARWAVYFDAIGCKWEYEPEGFHLPDGSLYLPDFWLSSVNMWAEVKPMWPTDEEIKKAFLLAQGTGAPILLLDGLPRLTNYWSIEPKSELVDDDEYQNCQMFGYSTPYSRDYYINDMYLGRKHNEHRFYGGTGGGPKSFGPDRPDDDQCGYGRPDAIVIALSARFEHGEGGGLV